MRKINRWNAFTLGEIFIDSNVNKQSKSIEEILDEKIKQQQLVNIYQKLDSKSKEILRLRIYEELSFKKIASKLKITEEAAKSRWRRARFKFSKLLEENLIEK